MKIKMNCESVLEKKRGQTVEFFEFFQPVGEISFPEIDEGADAACVGTLKVLLEPRHPMWNKFLPGHTYTLEIKE